VLPTRHVPPSGFGYPRGGLLPSKPCRFYFTPAALMGFTLRSLLLPKGIRPFPSGRTHLPFHSPVYPCTRRRRGRLGESRFLGFSPFWSPWRLDVCLAHRPLVAPLGFSFPGSPAEAWIGISPDLLSRASSTKFTPGHPRLRVSISFRSAPSAHPASRLGRVEHPRKVSAPS